MQLVPVVGSAGSGALLVFEAAVQNDGAGNVHCLKSGKRRCDKESYANEGMTIE